MVQRGPRRQLFAYFRNVLAMDGIPRVEHPLGQRRRRLPRTRRRGGSSLAGNTARSQMEGSLFAVNYWTVIAGGDLTYVSPAVISLQVEATFFQLTHVRGPETEDSSRTNFTGGMHAGHFFSPAFSLGAEFRIQRWLSTPAPVALTPRRGSSRPSGSGRAFISRSAGPGSGPASPTRAPSTSP